MNRKVNLSVVFFVLFSCASSLALIKGSESAISVLAGCVFPEGDSDNEMLGFGWFKNGFTLEDAATTCSFNSIFPVSGDIDLRGGTLHLVQDLVLKNPTVIQGFGTIVGNDHTVDLCASITWLPLNAAALDKTKLSLHEDLVLNSTMTFKGDCIVQGNDYTLDCTKGGLRVDKKGQLTLKNIKVVGLSGKNIFCEDDDGTLVLDDVVWRQNGDFVFDTGKIVFKNNVDFLGTYTFTYDSTQTSIISNSSQWKIGDTMRLSIGRKTAGGSEPLLLTGAMSKLYLDNCNFYVRENGMCLTTGRIVVDHDLYIDVASTSTENGLALGDGTSQGDMIVEIYPGGAARLRTGHLIYDITRPDAIKASSNSARFMRYDNSYYFIKHNIVLTDMLIYGSDFSHITLDTGAALSLDGCMFTRDNVECIAKASFYNAYTLLLGGGDYIYMTKGQMAMYSLVMGAGNKIHGSGIIGGGITLYNSASELIWALDGNLGNFLRLNGGLLTLQSDLICKNNVQLLGDGTVSLGNHRIKFGSSDVALPGSIYWDGAKGIVDISSTVALSGTWTFSGDCTVCSNYNILDLSEGNLVVDRGSQLTLRNIELRNVSGTNIRCIDDSASLILENVIWQQSDNFTFTVGALQFKNVVALKAPVGNIFAYQSSQTSTVCSGATLDLEGGITFSYDPGLPSKDLLEFIDQSSQLIIEDGSTLHTTGTGLTLTKGTLRIKEEGCLSSEVVGELDEGVTLGNGNSENDMVLMVCPGVKVKLLQGSLNYKNIDPVSCRTGNVMSIMCIGSGAALRLYQALNFTPGVVHFEDNAIFARSANKVLLGEVHVAGTLNYSTL